MAKRQYTDDDRAAALAALDVNGGNVAKTARDLQVPRVTLIEWRDGRVSDAVSDIRQVKKEALHDRLEMIAHSLVDAAPDKLRDASLQQVFTSLGIAVDKMQLLRNAPTAITETRNPGTPEERLQRLIESLGGDKREETVTPRV